MAKLVFGMNQSLDGYVDHTGFAPGPRLFRHFIDEARAQAGSLYGRRIYEIMRYWDEDQADAEPDDPACDCGIKAAYRPLADALAALEAGA